MKTPATAITVLFFTIIVTACSNSKKTTSSVAAEASVTGKKWQLVELMGQPVATAVNGKEPFIMFNKVDSTYAANGGCNGLGGKYTIDEKTMRIQFRQGMSTMMACADMTVEEGLKKVLGSADNYTVSDTALSLNKARMAPLARFKAVE
ncbi:META domain-containing protein [Foetidibacter luteolus]|uniref:META domain-containing protein n=1 Tax=Foetidibacter luteolus TaxID=2608880 RepID=UPI00129B0400|nr:META domain-containing protein [Foetidibacter luteolus]